MQMNWIYKDELLCEEDIPEGAVGFIYKITAKGVGQIPRELKGRFYIGKKQLSFTRKKTLTKKEKLLVENKRKRFKQVTFDSGWQEYNSSCKPLLEDIERYGKDSFKFEIIEFCMNKRDLGYREVFWQIKLDVLEENTYNGNIMNRFFKKKC